MPTRRKATTTLYILFLVGALAFYTLAYASTTVPQEALFSLESFRTWLDVAVVILVAYVGYQATKRDKREEKKDEFIEKIATIIWGDGKEAKGMNVRVEVLENNFSRCSACNGEHSHHRVGDKK